MSPYEVVLKALQQHLPVDVHWSAVEFELECASCTCGLWVGPGSCFESHRAEMIAVGLRDQEEAHA